MSRQWIFMQANVATIKKMSRQSIRPPTVNLCRYKGFKCRDIQMSHLNKQCHDKLALKLRMVDWFLSRQIKIM